MHVVNVELGDRSYPIHIGAGALDSFELLAPFLGQGRIVIISNDTVAPLYLEQARKMLATGGAEVHELILADGEQHKHLGTVNQIYDFLLQHKFDRKTTLVALGGGVIGDITGFVAATYQRGIDFIQIPTTLLAQVDSSVGGKTGVNHAAGKNMIGAFYQPRCVLIDTDVLATLPERELKAGLAEVIKYGLIGDRAFFDWLAANAAGILALEPQLIAETVRRCCEAKATIVTADEKEAGVRALLNLGHTFGHAIETATGYGNLLHGETVAMGMVMAADLSRRLGLLSAEEAARVRDVLQNQFQMETVPPDTISRAQWLDLMASDKKVEAGQIRFVLLNAIGDALVTGDFSEETLYETLQAGDSLCRD